MNETEIETTGALDTTRVRSVTAVSIYQRGTSTREVGWRGATLASLMPPRGPHLHDLDTDTDSITVDQVTVVRAAVQPQPTERRV